MIVMVILGIIFLVRNLVHGDVMVVQMQVQ
jgi:hypothetical protein